VEISSQKNPVLSLVIVVIVIFSTQPTSKEEKEALGSFKKYVTVGGGSVCLFLRKFQGVEGCQADSVVTLKKNIFAS